jgi:hypothetical protein
MVKSIEGLFKADNKENPDWREQYQKTARPGWIKRKRRKHHEAAASPKRAPR